MGRPKRWSRRFGLVALACALAACGSHAPAGDGPETIPFQVIEVSFGGDAPPQTSDTTSVADVPLAVEVSASTDVTVAAEATATADVANGAEVQDSGEQIDSYGAIGNDGFCFYGNPPSLDASAADVPQPAACSWAAVDVGMEAPDKVAKLQVEMGDYDDDGNWHTLNDGDWVPLLHGSQGKLMVYANFRVFLPGQTAQLWMVKAQADAKIDCLQVATSTPGTALTPFVVPAVDAGAYSNVTPDHPGFVTVFDALPKDSAKFCGKWLQLRLAVGDYQNPTVKNWGQTVRTVRLYDSTVVTPFNGK